MLVPEKSLEMTISWCIYRRRGAAGSPESGRIGCDVVSGEDISERVEKWPSDRVHTGGGRSELVGGSYPLRSGQTCCV